MIIFQCDTEGDHYWRRALTAITRKDSCKVKSCTYNVLLSTHREERKRRKGAKETFLKDCDQSSVSDWQVLSLRISSGLCGWNNRQGTKVGFQQLILRQFYYWHVILFWTCLCLWEDGGDRDESMSQMVGQIFFMGASTYTPHWVKVPAALIKCFNPKWKLNCWLLFPNVSLNFQSAHWKTKHWVN